MERYSLHPKNSIKEDEDEEPAEYFIIPRGSQLENLKYENLKSKANYTENLLDSPSKSVSSSHYLEKRFRPYIRASKHVTAVKNYFGLRANSFFDRAKEEHKSFLLKSPSKDASFHVSRLPEIPITKELELHAKILHSFRSLNSATRKNRDVSPSILRRNPRVSNSISYIEKSPVCKGTCAQICTCLDKSVHIRHKSGILKEKHLTDIKNLSRLRGLYLDPAKFSRISMAYINKA